MENDSVSGAEIGRAEHSVALGQTFLADLEEDYRNNGAASIGFLRQLKPVTYFRLILALHRTFGAEKPPSDTHADEHPTHATNAGQPNRTAAELADPNDPYRVLKRSIAIEKLREAVRSAEAELARLAAEEDEDARVAEEAIDANHAARRGASGASAAKPGAAPVPPTTETAPA